jgi:hypothetical protein
MHLSCVGQSEAHVHPTRRGTRKQCLAQLPRQEQTPSVMLRLRNFMDAAQTPSVIVGHIMVAGSLSFKRPGKPHHGSFWRG